MRTFFDTRNGVINENEFYMNGVYCRRTWDVVNDVDPLSPGPWDETPEILGSFTTKEEAEDYLAENRTGDDYLDRYPRLCIQRNTSDNWVDPREELRSRPIAKRVLAKIQEELEITRRRFMIMDNEKKWKNICYFARLSQYVSFFDAADYTDEELENMLSRENLLDEIDEYFCSDCEDTEHINRIKNAFISMFL